MVCSAVVACGDGSDLKDCSPTCGEGPFFAISELTFVTASTDGIAPGFNLDGLVSDGEAHHDCNTPDLTSPDGEPGIDNKLAWVLTQLGDDVLTSISDRFQQAINDGGFLFTVEQIERAEHSDLVFRRGAGQPLLDDGQRMQANQTLRLHQEPFLGLVENIEEIDGRGTSQAFALDMRFDSEGRPLSFTLLDSRFRFERQADGSMVGIFGGGVARQEAVDLIVGLLDGDEKYRAGVEAVMPALADLVNPQSGDCEHFSLTVAYKAVPIHIAAE